MFELLLLFVIIPVRMFMTARSAGHSGIKWGLIGSGAFLLVELSVLLVFSLIYYGLAYVLTWEEEFEELVFFNFFYLFAMCAGFACVEVLRFRLKNPPDPYFMLPPPPPKF